MKTFWAIIKLHEDETAQELLSTMFSKEEFNPQNAILIQENMAIVEVFFEETPPKKIAEAIGGYSDVRCGFGEISEECLKKAGISMEHVYPRKADGGIPLVEPTGGADEEPTHDDEAEVPPAEPTAGVEKETPHDEGEGASETEEDVPPTEPTAEADDEKNPGSEGTKNGKGSKAKRKAPDMIPDINAIVNNCTSYKQFAGKVVEWLGLEKGAEYIRDVFEVAAIVEKIDWLHIGKELRNKGYKNPSSVRNPISKEVTKKLAEKQINCSFIALVDYVSKYKCYDFSFNIEKKVQKILYEMGIEDQVPLMQKEITNIASAAVMAESENVDMINICTVAGYGKDDDEILDAKMNFSSFVNEFLQKKEMGMMTAEDFIIKLREAVFTGKSIW